MQATTALLTDHYELTMVHAALARGTAHRRSVFETFARRLPDGRRYGVVGGTGRLLADIERFRFDDATLAWLQDSEVVDDATVRWLADYRFTGNIWGYAEGECFFPYSPILIVEASFAEAVILETLILSVLNFDSAIAAAASRMTVAAGDRPCVEMGSRRTHEQAAVAAARAAYVAGFASTSNLEAGRTYGVPTRGTSAHSFTLLHDTERDAFTAQVDALGKGTTLLVDTYDVVEAVAVGVEIAGTELGAVRLDSGDLLGQAWQVREQLDALGVRDAKIVVSSDLNEHAIAALAAAPVDAYGVGTQLVTGSGAPTASMVYKLVARTSGDGDGEMIPVGKVSKDKPSVGGRKAAYRRRGPGGIADAEVIRIGSADSTVEDVEFNVVADSSREGDRPLLVPLILDGEVVGGEPLASARDRHAAARAELPPTARRMSHGEPAIPTIYEES